MAPDRSAEELRLELEALNQVLQYRCHSRCNSHRGASLRSNSSPKHPLQPKSPFKVSFRSTSVISSCSHFPSAQASPRCSKPPHHAKKEKEKQAGTPQHLERNRSQHEKKTGFWRSWPRPVRAISHLITSSHRRLQVLFSLHIHRVEGLPLPLNGLRLAVRWNCQDHGLQTMPSRIFHGTADFEETLAHRCTVYGSHSSKVATSRYNQKPSTVSIVALDVDELELAKYHMDLASLLQSHDIHRHPQQQIMSSYELSGMAKGSTLIVSFSHEPAHGETVRGEDAILVRDKQFSKLSRVPTESLALSKQGHPLVDASALESSSPLSGSGADAVLHRPNLQKLFLDELHIPLQVASSADNTILEGCMLPDHGYSSSFEFKPASLDSFAKDEHQEQFTFPRVEALEEVRPARIKNFSLSLDEEGQVNFPYDQTVCKCNNFKMREDEECELGAQMQSEQGKPQGTYYGESGRQCSVIGDQWTNEESKFLEVLQTESDDEADLIAEEFLDLLGIK